jgi:hypothetical protein
MATRAVVRVLDDDKKVIVNIYTRWNGYPSGLGAKMADFLTGFVLVNGLGADSAPKVANGMGCLAAQLVAYLKTGPAGVYLVPATPEGARGEDYVYTVARAETGKLHLTVREPGKRKPMSEGTPETFLTFWRR